MKSLIGTCGLLATLWLPAHLPAQQSPLPANHAELLKKSEQLFVQQVRTILVEQCVKCHGGEKTQSELDLTTKAGLLKGGELLGPLVVPFDSQKSQLLEVLRHQGDIRMPAGQPQLGKTLIAAIQRWIEMGAAYDRPLLESGQGSQPLIVSDEDRDYWAFRPLDPQQPPRVRTKNWVRSPIDQFILGQLEQARVEPATDADRRTLIRRANFDLIGLPPSPAEVSQFLAAEDSAAAWELLIDRLLESDHFGERWARHWLDAARFAESHGFEHDTDRNHAFHFRDFVIRAFNADMPYDQFVQWQLAGDELAPDNSLAMMATGFLGAGVYPTQITTSEAERVRYDALDDMLATTGTAMLGLTVGCARCHDHKYDPIPTADYYRLLSTFTTTVRSEIELATAADQDPSQGSEAMVRIKQLRQQLAARGKNWQPALVAWVQQQQERKAELPQIKDASQREAIKALVADKQPLAELSDGLKKAAQQWFLQHDKVLLAGREEVKQLETTYAVQIVQVTAEGFKPMRLNTSDGSIPDFYPQVYFLGRGEVSRKGEAAEQGFLQVLSRSENGVGEWIVRAPQGGQANSSYRRSGLAAWITDSQQGAGSLLARVIVNRIWHHHMGRGLVGTINDFGFQGDDPTHPALLEWLAADLVENGWQLKRLHKMILMSHVYQLSHQPSRSSLKRDPANILLGHWNRRRMEAEIVRDNLLAVGGLLDTTMYGAGTLDQAMKRRSIYFKVKRSQLIPLLRVFDWPDALSSLGVRPVTTVSPQALVFMNNPQVRLSAAGLARAVEPQLAESLESAIEAAYLRALGRPPTAEDLADGLDFLASRADQPAAALIDYCLVLMSSNEFIYIQ